MEAGQVNQVYVVGVFSKRLEFGRTLDVTAARFAVNVIGKLLDCFGVSNNPSAVYTLQEWDR